MIIKETVLVKNVLDILEKDFPGCKLHFMQYTLDDTKRDTLISIMDLSEEFLPTHKLSDKVYNLIPGGKFHLPIEKYGEKDTSYISYSYKAYVYQNRLVKINSITI